MKRQRNPLVIALVAELGKHVADAENNPTYAQAIARRMVKMAHDSTVPLAIAVQAAKEVRELTYSEYGKPTQPIDTGFDLSTMIARLRK